MNRVLSAGVIGKKAIGSENRDRHARVDLQCSIDVASVSAFGQLDARCSCADVLANLGVAVDEGVRR